MSFTFKPKDSDRQYAIICAASLGKNGRGAHKEGRDYWVTLRGASDRLSKDFILVGVCHQGEVVGEVLKDYRIVGTYGYLPFSVELHLETMLKEAYKGFDENEAYICELQDAAEQDQTSSDAWQYHKPWLQFLPSPFSGVFEGEHGDRFFVCIARKDVGQYRS